MFFEVNGKQYHASDAHDDAKFRIQVGKRDKSGKIRWNGRNVSNNPYILTVYRCINIGNGYCKRLTYRPSIYSKYYEIHKAVS